MKEKLIRKIADNHGVKIEYYVSNQVNTKPSLILSMGIWEPAFRAFPLLARLAEIHCIVLSYRGRGGSTTPVSGYDWIHHALDLACVLEKEPVNQPIFLGFSKGVSYMLGYLSSNPKLANGIIIIDYPGIHTKPEKGFAKLWYNRDYNGFKLGDYITKQALEGIERESSGKEFYDDLNKMDCPIWVFRGKDSQAAIPSNLDSEDLKKYQNSVKRLEIVDFEYSGHMILEDELGKSTVLIRSILEHTAR